MALIYFIYVDRYDARGALHDLSALEAPPGGFDWRVELTKAELDVEQLCDEERYRALHTDEDEEEMYKGIILYLIRYCIGNYYILFFICSLKVQ